MKTLSSILLGASAGLATFAAVAVASSAPVIEAPKDQTSVHEMKVAQLDAEGRPPPRVMSPDAELPPPGRRGPPPGSFGRPQGPFGPMGPLGLAGRLSAEETAIGIRAAQLDAWRNYADALQSVLAPPPPPSKDLVTDPFALAEALAVHAEERGKAGTALKTAVAALRSQLTPEQLVRAARVMGPPPPPPPGLAPHEFPAGPREGLGGAEPGPSSPR
ncbi:hypothetical protein [Methylopila sp. Yamaguchi]|uniref:hypothetical protein n=1 Tax=Methylopila sp. Yamaguchi TaxID=1437817 RepID=UPI000CB1317D|nr:hypothetical protein [Methylopila sp. Yamaguchi]GBD48376.1 hypothetical protein METY_1589 [Methylopila sp. Yamaguchi]